MHLMQQPPSKPGTPPRPDSEGRLEGRRRAAQKGQYQAFSIHPLCEDMQRDAGICEYMLRDAETGGDLE